ncbi:MAG: TonB-dependent receptor [Chitinophagaceae bacterium]
MKICSIKYYQCLFLLLFCSAVSAQQKDSSATLQKVTVEAQKKKNTFTTVTPTQSLNGQALQQINAQSIGDAARYFSGVLVKDYGGVGGLKTVSVRSLGAAHTGVHYDGIPVSDAQAGQVDLSRYSPTFVQSIDLQYAGVQKIIQPARAFSYGALLDINTYSFSTAALQRSGWQAMLKQGSFGLWQPSAGVNIVLPKHTAISLNGEAVFSKGNYPFTIDNGSFSEDAKRENSEVKSQQGEVNVIKMFTDSSTLQVKAGGYHSSRGLPGAIIFFNDRSVQHLWNTDYFAQARYRTTAGKRTEFILSGKYSHNYTRYTDPDYLNNQGGLDNRYTQQEFYFSAAAGYNITEQLKVAASSDVAFAKLSSNLTSFVYPSRKSFWNNLALYYSRQLWQVTASALLTTIADDTRTGTAAATINKLTPAVALSIKPAEKSPFMFRASYRHVFRMPTFNDLYYNFVGNSSLRPEYARQYNAGIVYTNTLPGNAIKHLSISADAYYNTVKDKIVAIPNKNLFTWTMLNLGKVDIKGIDLAVETDGQLSRTVNWFARVAYTYQQAIDITDPSTATYKNRIPYTPDHSGSALAGLRYRQWSAGYNIIFSATRYTLGENNPYNQLDGWNTQDLYLSRAVDFRKFQATIKATLENFTNQRYDIVRYFPMPGRSYKISIILNHL